MRFTLPQRQKMPTPPRTAAIAPKRDGPKPENVGADAEKDDMKRQRERITLNKPKCFCLLYYFFMGVYYISNLFLI